MGNVLLNYSPLYSVEKLCRSDEAKEIILREFFGGPEWIETDRGTMTPEERYISVRKRIPECFHEDFDAVSVGWDICMTPLDGALSFLEHIKENGFGLYLLSNASSEFYRYFPRAIDPGMFDGIVVSSDIKLIKPDMRIYEYLLDKYRLTPGECLFIDDRADNAAAAEKTGMQALVFTGDYREAEKRAGMTGQTA